MQRFLCVTLWSSIGVCAQVVPPVEPRGPFAAITHAFSLAQQTPEIALKVFNDVPPGYPLLPLGPPAAGAPDFSPAALFGQFAPWFDIDAMSSGNDLLPLNAHGWIDPDPLSPSGWVAFTFSVTHDTAGDANTIIHTRAQNPGGPGADLFGYFLPGSNTNPQTGGVPNALVGTVVLEQGAEHMGIGPTTNREIDAHDAMIPYLQAGFGVGGIIQTTTDFYFSVTNASASALATERSTNQPLDAFLPPNVTGGDILHMTRQPNGPWQPPTLFRTAHDLGIADDQDLDALAVDQGAPYGPNILYSTNSPAQPQLLLQHGTDPAGEARDRNGQPLRLVDVGDVDAICSFDPEVPTGNAFIGEPRALGGGLTPTMGLSVCGNGSRYYAVISGWPNGVITPGSVYVWAQSGTDSPVLLEGPLARTTADHSMNRHYLVPSGSGPIRPVSLFATFVPSHTTGTTHVSWGVLIDP